MYKKKGHLSLSHSWYSSMMGNPGGGDISYISMQPNIGDKFEARPSFPIVVMDNEHKVYQLLNRDASAHGKPLQLFEFKYFYRQQACFHV
jgi:hypothetical protein